MLLRRLKSRPDLIFTIFCLMVITWCGASLLAGDRGISARAELTGSVASLETRRNALGEDVSALEAKVRMLQPGTLDYDLLEERAKIMTGYTRPNELVVKVPSSE